MKRAMKSPRKQQGNEEAETTGKDLLFWMGNIYIKEIRVELL